jgi:hypothetical protein
LQVNHGSNKHAWRILILSIKGFAFRLLKWEQHGWCLNYWTWMLMDTIHMPHFLATKQSVVNACFNNGSILIAMILCLFLCICTR